MDINHKTFLNLWFPLSWIIMAGISAFVVRFLWDPVIKVAGKFGIRFRRFIAVAFPAGIVLPAFAAFLSVGYLERGCGEFNNSAEVIRISDQVFYVAEHEVSKTAETLAYVLLVWAAIYAVLLISWKKSHSTHR